MLVHVYGQIVCNVISCITLLFTLNGENWFIFTRWPVHDLNYVTLCQLQRVGSIISDKRRPLDQLGVGKGHIRGAHARLRGHRVQWLLDEEFLLCVHQRTSGALLSSDIWKTDRSHRGVRQNLLPRAQRLSR